MIFFLSLGALICAVSVECADPFDFGIGKIPPYGIPLVEAEEEEAEKGLEAGKELTFEKAFPWLEKEFTFDNGVAAGLDIEKELELEKILGMGFEKGIGFEKTMWYPNPWVMWEKYFGIGKRKITFELALAFELYKRYGYYGLWVAKELERRFTMAKRLGLIGQEIAFQEAITLGLFKGIGLDKIFEASLTAIGAKKAAAAAEATKESLEKVFGPWKMF